jgi:peptide/nickel transport system ATP-binding protein
MSERLLEIRDLRIDLPMQDELKPVIQEVSLGVAQGEAVGLVGESGAGKSMTSRAVICLLPPGAQVTGAILFDGHDVPAMNRETLRRYRAGDVAMIFQDPRAHVNPVRRIGDFLTEALVTNAGVAPADAEGRVTGLLRDVGIDDAGRRLRQYPHELSGGLLQRVMIASALAIAPRLLLADEPTTSLDVTTQSEVMAILDEQRRQRDLAMIFVTHDLELAAAVCDRIAVMYAGYIVEDRAATAMHESARHPYTAGLLASRPSPTTRSKRLWAIPGRPLSAYEVTDGCPFTTRCPFVVQHCRDERQVLREVDGGLVRCHRAEELRGRLAEGYEREVERAPVSEDAVSLEMASLEEASSAEPSSPHDGSPDG